MCVTKLTSYYYFIPLHTTSFPFSLQDNAKAETKSVSNGDVVSVHEESTHTHLGTVINTQGSMESSSEEDNSSAQPDQVQVQFHDVLKDYVGDFGFYQILYTLHKSWSTCLACMYTLVTVFLAAVPEHRCDLRDSARAGFNCTEEQLVATFIPNEKRHGQILPSQCQYYNFSALSYNFSDVSISLDQCTMGNMSDLLPLVDCDKWKYDTSFYKSTIIDEVDFLGYTWFLSNIVFQKIPLLLKDISPFSGTLCVRDQIWRRMQILCIGSVLWLDC